MAPSDLVRMANQIGANFAHLGDETAAAETADHLRRFWAPSMRQEFLEAVGASELNPVARGARELLLAETGL